MKPKTIIILISVLVAAGSIFYAMSGGESLGIYSERLEDERKDNNRFMRFSDESPLSDEGKEEFTTLNYYPANLDYKINARLIPINDGSFITTSLNDGKERKYLKYAWAEFIIDNQPCKLLLLQSQEQKGTKELFVAFADETSGYDTYGGGRYLDLEQKKKSQITIDFNKAYNPYCVFDEKYVCPLPPRENQLSVAILAGEKNYGK